MNFDNLRKYVNTPRPHDGPFRMMSQVAWDLVKEEYEGHAWFEPASPELFPLVGKMKGIRIFIDQKM